MTKAKEMLEAYETVAIRLKREMHSTTNEAEKQVLMYLAYDIIPDEIEFWESGEADEEGSQ